MSHLERNLIEDELAVIQTIDDAPIVDETGRLDARIVFTQTLFFEGGNDPQAHLRALEALAGLAADVEGEVAVMELPSGGLRPWNLTRFREQGQAAITAAFKRPLHQRAIDIAFHGDRRGGISVFGGSMSALPPLVETDADLNLLEASTSLMWDAHGSFHRQIERTVAAATRLKPAHGLAGFGILFDRSGASTSSRARALPVIQRFAGLHCGLDISFLTEATMRRATPDRYLSINWLTVLGTPLLEQLGSAVLDALPEACIVHFYDGGVVIQAGPRPQLGDGNHGAELEAYRAVDALLAPLRFEDYRVGILPVPRPRDSLAETLQWVRRFTATGRR